MRHAIRTLMLCVWCWVFGVSALLGAEPTNLLKDAGFEAVKEGAFASWNTPNYWQGKLAVVTEKGKAHGGARCAELSATEKGGQSWGRVLYSGQFPIAQGARYRLSVWAKGKGQLALGCIEYGKKDDKTTYLYTAAEKPADLANDWREVVFHFTAKDPTATVVAFYAEVRGGQSAALLDDAFFGLDPLPGYSLTMRQGHTMMPQGGKVAFRIQATAPAGATCGPVVVRHENPSKVADQKEVALDPTGKGLLEFAADDKTENGVHAVSFVLKPAGIPDTAHVDVVDAAMFKAFAAAADATKVEKPAHLIFVGDSLTAFYRGYNYVDKVRGWLQQKHGPEVQVTNAGVGGDYTTRVLARLEKDVLDKKPTHVFVFLGHNDSKLKSTTDYKEPVVLPETFDKEYREIVQAIKDKAKARVTIISATSSVYEITKATADKAREAGRAHNLFGKPETLEQFNAIAKKVASDLGAGYLDVYEPTRMHPNKPSLFTADGVHISNEGNRVVALEILKYLGKP